MARHHLTELEAHQFVQRVASGEAPAKVVESMGYANPYTVAKKLMSTVEVKQEILAIMERTARKFDISREDVLIGLKEAIEQAKILADPGAQISGWKEIGKMLGYYEAKKQQVEVKVVGGVVHHLQSLSDADLVKLASGQQHHLPAIIDAEVV